jgi:hypothetical protein
MWACIFDPLLIKKKIIALGIGIGNFLGILLVKTDFFLAYFNAFRAFT